VALPGGKQPAPTEHEKTNHQPASSETASASTFQPQTRLTKWTIGDIPESIQTTIATGSGRQEVTGYPALQTGTGDQPTADLVLMRTKGEHHAVHRTGVIALLPAELPNPQRYFLDHLSPTEKLAFASSPYPTSAALVADCIYTAIDALVPDDAPITKHDYQHLAQAEHKEPNDNTIQLTYEDAKI